MNQHTPRFLPQLITLLTTLFAGLASADSQVPQNVRIDCTEKILSINWDSVPGAIGYNLYSHDGSSERRKINRMVIATRPHFAFVWEYINGEKTRNIKGYAHNISVTSLTLKDNDTTESAHSVEVSNNYFEGYSNVLSKDKIRSILSQGEETMNLPIDLHRNRAKEVIRFMEIHGIALYDMIRERIDPREVGACSPITTVLVKLLSEAGIEACKAEGTFIKEYHSFVLLNIDHKEYILDFTADQFVPDVSRILIPVNQCFLKNGRLGSEGKPVYQVARIYSAENVKLADSSESELYHQIYAALSNSINSDK